MISSRNVSRLSFLPIALLAAVASAAEFYVSPSGDDADAGTSASAPWRTIAKANAELEPGDVVYLRGGKYVNDPIRPANSGKAAAEIRYTAYENEKPVLTSDKVGGLPAAIELSNRSYIRIEGVHVDGVEPSPDARVKHFALISNGSYNTLARSTFKYAIGWGGIVFDDDSHHNRLLDNVIDVVGIYDDGNGNDYGDAVQIKAASHHNLLRGNTIRRGAHNLLQVQGQFNVIRENVFDNDWSELVGAGKGGRNLSLMGRYNLFEGNIVRNSGRSIDQPANAGMKVEGRNNIVRRNFIYGNMKEGVTTQSRSGQKWAHDNRIFHNTFYSNGGPAWGLVFYDGGNGVTGNVFKNNIVYSNRRDSSLGDADIVFKLALNPMGLVGESQIENNLMARSGTNDATVEVRDGGGLMSLTQAEQKFAKYIKNNIQKTPTFVSPDPRTPEDFALADGSQGIDAGAPLTHTKSAGSGKVVPLDDAGYFAGGLSLISGDRIRIGSGQPLTIVDVDYSSHTVTLADSTAWEGEVPVHLAYRGAAPDIGAYETGLDTPVRRQPRPPSVLTTTVR